MEAEIRETAIKIPEKILGKPFGIDGLTVVREETCTARPYNRAEIARRVCMRLGWRSPGGRYQFMTVRVALLRLYRAGLITLPPPIRTNGNGRKLKFRQTALPDERPVTLSVDQLSGLKLQLVEGVQQSALYNAMMDRYHYLGFCPMAGAQVRYVFEWEHGVLGAIGFGASAWKVAPRDTHIGWGTAVREKNLHLILNNSRFLILPWVHSANLASKILAVSASRIPVDFMRMYGYRPVLLETFVERDRFRGVCYQAANWVHVGHTQGRGKKHLYKTPGVAVKDIWLYPLRRDFRRLLESGGDR
jgi:hypothetical protein